MKRLKGDLNTGLLVLSPIFATLSIAHAISVIWRYDPLSIVVATVYCLLFSALQISIFRRQSKGRIPKKMLWMSLFYSVLIVLIYPGLMNISISPTMNPFAQMEAVVGIIFGIVAFANAVRGLR